MITYSVFSTSSVAILSDCGQRYRHWQTNTISIWCCQLTIFLELTKSSTQQKANFMDVTVGID